MDYELLRGKLNDALEELRYLSIKEDFVDMKEALRCTAGGYGDVYRATLQGLGSANRIVAVKELRAVGDDATRIRSALRLTRELRVWARLKHPNVLELVGYHLNPQMTTAWLISPFMTNGNIDEYLENTPEQDSDSLRIKLLRDSLNGLIYLHTLRPPICHADIKPDNVLITDRVEAVLCDFGLARLADGQPSGLTTSKTIKGSTRYMSPELLEENAVQTLRSDVWAYACLVLKVMTGSFPYAKARTDQQIILALVLKQPPAEPADLELRDGRLKTLLAKCWDINPAARPSATECLHYITKAGTTQVQLNSSSVAQNLPYLESLPTPPSNSVSDPTPSFHELDTPPISDRFSKATTSALILHRQAEPIPPDGSPKLALSSEYAHPAGTLAPPPNAPKKLPARNQPSPLPRPRDPGGSNLLQVQRANPVEEGGVSRDPVPPRQPMREGLLPRLVAQMNHSSTSTASVEAALEASNHPAPKTKLNTSDVLEAILRPVESNHPTPEMEIDTSDTLEAVLGASNHPTAKTKRNILKAVLEPFKGSHPTPEMEIDTSDTLEAVLGASNHSTPKTKRNILKAILEPFKGNHPTPEMEINASDTLEAVLGASNHPTPKTKRNILKAILEPFKSPKPSYTDAGLGDPGYGVGGQGFEKEGYSPHRLDMGTPPPSAPLMAGSPINLKPYGPSDPSTFPVSPSYPGSPAPGSTLVSHETGMQSGSYQTYPSHQQGYPPNQQYKPGGYSGAAEV